MTNRRIWTTFFVPFGVGLLLLTITTVGSSPVGAQRTPETVLPPLPPLRAEGRVMPEAANETPNTARPGSPAPGVRTQTTSPSAPSRPVPFGIGNSWVSAPVDTPATMGRNVGDLPVAPAPVILFPDTTSAGTPRPIPAAPPARVAPPRGAAADCGGGSIAELLSPACLDALRTLRPGGGGTAESGLAGLMPPVYAPPPVAQTVACNVSLLSGTTTPPSVTSFQSPDLPACFQAGAQLSFGVPGVSNIVAVTPQWGVMSVVCVRQTDNAMNCAPQPR